MLHFFKMLEWSLTQIKLLLNAMLLISTNKKSDHITFLSKITVDWQFCTISKKYFVCVVLVFSSCFNLIFGE